MASPVHAGTGGYYLEVDKKVYLQGQCKTEPAGPHGGFSIGAAVTRTGYFAYVLVDETGIARGYWNGTGAESHAVGSAVIVRDRRFVGRVEPVAHQSGRLAERNAARVRRARRRAAEGRAAGRCSAAVGAGAGVGPAASRRR
jgi:hypothetical protein